MVNERRTFGERLRRQRERREVSLQTIADNTKVPSALYAGLERGDCARWPAGLYSRAYVRAYAESIGLDGRDTIDEFTALYGDTPANPSAAIVPVTARRDHLRLSMADEPAVDPQRIGRRAALAAAELVIGVLIAAIAHVGVGLSAWTTVACVLTYFVVGRLVSDEPLLYWAFLRARTPSPQPLPDDQAEDVPVVSAASTTA